MFAPLPGDESAEIVAPIAETDIGCSAGELGLVIEDFPFILGISGKTDRIPVAAESAPAVIDHSSRRLLAQMCCLADHVVEKDVEKLVSIADTYDDMAIVTKMKAIVPEYKSNNSVFQQLDKKD